MARLHLSHPDISEEFLEAIRTMVADDPWQLPGTERALVVKAFYETVCESAEGVSVPDVEFYRAHRIRRHERGYTYTPEITGSLGLSVTPAKIALPRWRTTEIVTAIRHHFEFVGGNRHADPIAWGCSAVYQATPLAFRSAARAGKVRGVEPKDTYTTASWQKLLDNGLVDTRGRLRFSNADTNYFLQHGQMPTPSAPEPAEIPAADMNDEQYEEYIAAVEAEEQEDTADLPEEGAVYQEATEGPFEGTLVAPNEITDGLDGLGIVQLRKVSRGAVSGGYSMTKPVLIHAIRQALSASEIAAKIGSL